MEIEFSHNRHSFEPHVDFHAPDEVFDCRMWGDYMVEPHHISVSVAFVYTVTEYLNDDVFDERALVRSVPNFKDFYHTSILEGLDDTLQLSMEAFWDRWVAANVVTNLMKKRVVGWRMVPPEKLKDVLHKHNWSGCSWTYEG